MYMLCVCVCVEMGGRLDLWQVHKTIDSEQEPVQLRMNI